MKTINNEYESNSASLILSAAYVKAESVKKKLSLSAYSDGGTLIASRESHCLNACTKEEVIKVNRDGINNIVVKSEDEILLLQVDKIIKRLIGEL